MQISIPFEKKKLGPSSDNDIFLDYKDLTAKHQDRHKCAELMKDAIEFNHWNRNSAGHMTVNILDVSEKEAVFEVLIRASLLD